ncbi:MAG: hypothetical protein HY314_12980 [Acidobacteria bacterium]|nr:hypothetical protein [Acidobacteriota bacterium]
MRPAAKKVAVAVPMPSREDLMPEEQISLNHLVNYLGSYDKYLVIPKSLKVQYPGFGLKRFSDRFFGSVQAHTRLMLSRRFYEAFLDYEYVLIYHLDALVFSDQLLQWCAADLDYIGAPWLKFKRSPQAGFSRVGNGGFSLRKIASFLKVIDSPVVFMEPTEHWELFWASKPKHVQYVNLPRKYLKHLNVFNNARWRMRRYRRNEDHFWSEEATRFYPQFGIAPVELALRFAFECAPRFCYEKNNYTLPFGCHAWFKYDREFWEPYLLR